MKPTLLSIGEAAARRGVSRQTIYSAIARKMLPRRYWRGSLVVHEADLVAWQASTIRGGFPKGREHSATAKAKIAESQRKRWAKRRGRFL